MFNKQDKEVLQAGVSAAHPPCLRPWGCRSDEPQDLDGFLSICNREGEG